MEAGILLWIQEVMRNPILSAILIPVTYLGEGGILWLIITVVLLLIPKTRRNGFVMFFALFFTKVGNDMILKNLVARPRPYMEIEGLECIIKESTSFSFPSGHTACAFAVIFVAFYMKWAKKFLIPTVIMALLISFSRLYVGIHYPTDVLGGAVTGLLYGYLACLIGNKLCDMKEIKKADSGKEEDKDEGPK